MVGWIVFLALAVPLVAIFVWLIMTDSVVNVPSGRLGLLMIKGRATDKVLLPGPHWVPALRRRMVEEYPSLELSYRALRETEAPADTGDLGRTGPAPRVTLGDRTEATLGYTVRFRLDVARLRAVHERFGPDGFWAAVRDISTRAVRSSVSRPDVGVENLFGAELVALEERIGAAVREALALDGLIMTMFALGDLDLGRTGQVIQSIVRARLEQDREEAEAALRVARARIDAELGPYVTAASDAALRYREVDVWRDLVHSSIDRTLAVPARSPAARTPAESAEASAEAEPAAAEADEP